MGTLVVKTRWIPAPFWALLPGLAALLAEPLRWLAVTWIDPAYDSQGALVAGVAAFFIVRSLASGPAPSLDVDERRLAVALLLGTASVRLLGRLLAVHVIGALALVLDVAALALWLRLHRRPWALRPWALALLFSFAFPVEHVLQRVLGYPLRLAGAALAEGALRPFFPTVARAGTLLSDGALRLHVDLPCSGAQGLMLLGALAAALACRRALTGRLVALAGVAVVGGALVVNALRIALLFVGARAALPVWQEPWHSAIGLACLAFGAAPLLLLLRGARSLEPRPGGSEGCREEPRARSLLAGAAFSALAIGVALVPGRPLDVGEAGAGPALPHQIYGFESVELPLSDVERAYFAAYGGAAEKRAYTDEHGAVHVAVLVRTTSPLRHLHGPDRCLVGAGHEVERLGVRPGLVPTVVYRSRAPDGRRFLVEVVFLSERGETAASVSEVAWRWLSRPGTAWTLVERVHPEGACHEGGSLDAPPLESRPLENPCERLERALLSATHPDFAQEQQR